MRDAAWRRRGIALPSLADPGDVELFVAADAESVRRFFATRPRATVTLLPRGRAHARGRRALGRRTEQHRMVAIVDGEVVGHVAVIRGVGWCAHVGELRLVVDPATAATGSAACWPSGPSSRPSRWGHQARRRGRRRAGGDGGDVLAARVPGRRAAEGAGPQPVGLGPRPARAVALRRGAVGDHGHDGGGRAGPGRRRPAGLMARPNPPRNWPWPPPRSPGPRG